MKIKTTITGLCYAAIVIAFHSTASAESYDIDNTGNWTTETTWAPDIAGGPTATDSLVITNDAYGIKIVELDTNATISSIDFDKSSWVQFSRHNKGGAKTITVINDLTKDGSEGLYFEGNECALTVSGNVHVVEGMLALARDRVANINIIGTTTVDTGTTLQLRNSSTAYFGNTEINGTFAFQPSGTSSSADIDGLTGSGVITNAKTSTGSATLYFSQTNGTYTFSGNIGDTPGGGTYSVTSYGYGGTQELSGNNSYVGQTWPREGTLKVSGTHTTGSKYYIWDTLLVEKGAMIATTTFQLQKAGAAPYPFVQLNGGILQVTGDTGTTDQGMYFSAPAGAIMDFNGGTLALKGTWDLATLTALANSDFTVQGEDDLSKLQFTAGTGDFDGYTLIGFDLPDAGTVLIVQ